MKNPFEAEILKVTLAPQVPTVSVCIRAFRLLIGYVGALYAGAKNTLLSRAFAGKTQNQDVLRQPKASLVRRYLLVHSVVVVRLLLA